MALPRLTWRIRQIFRLISPRRGHSHEHKITLEVLERSPKDRPHQETPQFPNEFDPTGPPVGKIYDKKPFKMYLEAGKRYAWCACGQGHSQPLCDLTHKKLWGTSRIKTMPKWQPIVFKVEESKEYWLCNCKQSRKRPFCDGTHKREDIQSAIR